MPGSGPTRDAARIPLAGRHDANDVELALVRMAVAEQVRETGGRYALRMEEP